MNFFSKEETLFGIIKKMNEERRRRQKCILIVDDDLSVRTLFSRFLKKEGYLVTAVKDGYEGIKAIEKQIFDLVLIDLAMPGMNGIEVLENIKKRRSEVPVLIYTGYGSSETFAEAIKKGALDCLNKPFTLQELKIIVRKNINNDGF